MLLLLLLLFPLTSPTLLFFVPEGPDSTELRSSIKHGIKHLSRGLWYDLDHKIVSLRPDSMVRTLVGSVEDGVTAVLGVFSDQQIENITAIVDAFDVPTFVLNQVTRTPSSPNVFLTTPSIEFEMKTLEKVLDFYQWQEVSYYVQANTSVTNLLQGKGPCWDKLVLDPAQITEQTCRNFSVVILVGYSTFQGRFLDHYTRSGCRSMVVMQYFLEDQPSASITTVSNRSEIGDLIMLFPKSYPMINTGSSPRESAKYSCLLPSCMQYKINNQYRQSESVRLLLDSLKLIEMLLRQRGTLQSAHIRDVAFNSITGEQTELLENGFSYNRMNIFKSGTTPGVELLGWADERGTQIVPTTWKSSARTKPLRSSGGCSNNFSTPANSIVPVEKVLSSAFDLKGPTRIVAILLILIMLIAVLTLYVSRRAYQTRVPVGFMFPYMLACLSIALTSCFVIEEYDSARCLMVVLRDTFEYIFFALILYQLLSYQSESKVAHITFTGILLLIKFLVTIQTIINKNSTDFCLAMYFSRASSHLLFALMPLSILLIILKHFADAFSTVRWILIAQFTVLMSEMFLYYSDIPLPCKVAVYSIRAFATTVAYIFSGREGAMNFEKDDHESEDIETGKHHYEGHNMDHSLHCMEMEGDGQQLLQNEHTSCRHCDLALSPQELLTCPPEGVTCSYVESPSLYWDDVIQQIPVTTEDSGSDQDITDDVDNIRVPPSTPNSFPERVKFNSQVIPEREASELSSKSETFAERDDITSEDEESEPEEETVDPSTLPALSTVPTLPTVPAVPVQVLQQVIEPPESLQIEWNKPQEYDGEEITCYQDSFEMKCYTTGPLSGISEEDEFRDDTEEEETQIQVGFRGAINGDVSEQKSDLTNGESGFYSSNSNSTEPDYVNVINGQSILDEIVLIKANSGAKKGYNGRTD